MTIRVRDIAEELGVPSADVLEQLRKLYVDAEDDNSVVDDKIVGLIRIKMGGSVSSPKKSKTKKKPAEKAAKKKKTAAEKPSKKKKEDEPEEGKKKKAASKAAVPKETKKKTVKKKKEKADVPPEEKTSDEDKVPDKKPEGKEVPRPAEETVAKKETSEKAEVTIRKSKKGIRNRPTVEIIERGGKPAPPSSKAKKTARPGSVVSRPQVKPAASVTRKEAKPVSSRKSPKKVQMQVPINIRSLAPRINLKPNDIIQYLMGHGLFANINQDLEEDVVRDIMDHFGYELEVPETLESMEKDLVAEHHDGEKAEKETRSPVVTFMGHVDHGKTSLLDYIRKTMVTKGEKGGITQHIGAYKVSTAGGSVTFLDTPGHAAFTAMRARGANATDVVVLVVAADDGVMPQTKEAIDHARAAGVPIVVAINKCDLPGANPDRVKTELSREDLICEELGGKTVMVQVSAKTGEGVDNLVEMLMLESELLELKANPDIKARGIVIEGKKTPGQGVVVTLLVQNGTLYPGNIVLCGSYYGKVKAMMNDLGERVEKAPPATPVEVLGLQGIPEAGEEFFVVKDEKKARTLSTLKQDAHRKKGMARTQKVTLEDLHSRIMEGDMKELKMVLKADVQGSIEALKQSLEDLSTSEVKLNVIHWAVGNVNESDVMLATVSDAIVIGFNVKADTKAEELSKSENIDMRMYDVIYEAIADVKAGMEGLLEPEEVEVFQGRAQVRAVFSSSKAGKVAGCAVTKGTIHRKDRVRVKRGQDVIHEGNINALKRFKDDVRDVKEGFECGISINGFNGFRENDVIESFSVEKRARRLEK